MTISRLLALSVLAFVAACGGGDDQAANEELVVETEEASEDDGPGTLLEIIEDEPRFSTLAEALEAADLEVTFDTEGPLTVFAPNNEAFETLPEAASLDVLTAPENQALLRRILAYHVVPGRIGSADLEGEASEAMTIEGASLSYDGTGSVLTVGRAPGAAVVVISDIEAENGVIHVIDSVLLPPSE